jgi:hypothetical protein
MLERYTKVTLNWNTVPWACMDVGASADLGGHRREGASAVGITSDAFPTGVDVVAGPVKIQKMPSGGEIARYVPSLDFY